MCRGEGREIVLIDLGRDDLIALRLDNEDITAEGERGGERPVARGRELAAAVFRQGSVKIELAFRAVEISIQVDRGRAQSEPLDGSLASEQYGQIAAVTTAYDGNAFPVDSRLAGQQIV